ncbi:MAG: hypothetical protein AAGI52_03295 [Bacteroidota bacterium]
MMSFLLLAGLGSYLVVGLLCVAAFAVAGAGAYFYFNAKKREEDPSASALPTGEPAIGLREMRDLTSRIEEIVTTQQDHGETQRAHLSRKIDQVRESVESQHHAVTGLRHEFRHEIDRRDSELHEIRNQIASVREELALPPAEFTALPPSTASLGAPEPGDEMTPITFEAEDATFTETPASSPDTPSGASDLDAPAFDEMAFAPLDASPEEATPAGLALAFEEDAPPLENPGFSFQDMALESTPDAPTFEEAPDPLDPSASPEFAFEEAAFETPPVFSFEEDEPTAEPAAEPPVFSFEEEVAVAESPPAPEPERPVFSFEEDASPATPERVAQPPVFSFEEAETPAETPAEAPTPEPAEAFQVVSFLEPEAAEPEAAFETPPVFSFEEDETPAEARPVAPAPLPAFSFEEEPEPIEETSEPATAPASVLESATPVFTESEPAEAAPAQPPMALAFEEDEVLVTGHVSMAATPDATARVGAPPTPPVVPPPAPTFAPPLTDTSAAGAGADDSAWISRADRQPPEQAPVETIGGIAVERVGDVPPASVPPVESAPESPPGPPAEEPRASAPPVNTVPAEPQTASQPEPAAEPVVFEDEFPSPVVASELAVESLDFGIDVDAELAAAGQEPVEEPPASTPIRRAPVPPLRMEVPSPEPTPAGTPELTGGTSPAPDTPAAEAPAEAPAEAELEPEEVEPYVLPEGAEDLTLITSIDDDMMRTLHMAGVLTLDEIARWGRTDARRVASTVGVTEETIMHQWIFEAQSALFERYSRR